MRGARAGVQGRQGKSDVDKKVNSEPMLARESVCGDSYLVGNQGDFETHNCRVADV